MPLKKRKPTTRSQRGVVLQTTEDVTEQKPKKSVLLPMNKKAGRNNRGKITVRHRGGGHKRRLRAIDFKRDKPNVPGEVASIEYDPNRSARIALIKYRDGDWRYILAPHGLKVGRVEVAIVGREPVSQCGRPIAAAAGDCMGVPHDSGRLPVIRRVGLGRSPMVVLAEFSVHVSDQRTSRLG